MAAPFRKQLAAYLYILLLEQVRSPLWMALDILLPIGFVLGIAGCWRLVPGEAHPERRYASFPVTGTARDYLTHVDGVPLLLTNARFHKLLYAPSNAATDAFMAKFQHLLLRLPHKLGRKESPHAGSARATTGPHSPPQPSSPTPPPPRPCPPSVAAGRTREADTTFSSACPNARAR